MCIWTAIVLIKQCSTDTYDTGHLIKIPLMNNENTKIKHAIKWQHRVCGLERTLARIGLYRSLAGWLLAQWVTGLVPLRSVSKRSAAESALQRDSSVDWSATYVHAGVGNRDAYENAGQKWGTDWTSSVNCRHVLSEICVNLRHLI